MPSVFLVVDSNVSLIPNRSQGLAEFTVCYCFLIPKPTLPPPSSFTNAQPPTCSMDHDLLRIACPLFSACFSGCEHQLQMRVCVPGKGPCLRVSVFLWVSFLCVAVRFWHLFIFSSQLECARSTFGFTLACHQGPQPVFIHGRRVYINFSTSQHVHGQCSLQHRKM